MVSHRVLAILVGFIGGPTMSMGCEPFPGTLLADAGSDAFDARVDALDAGADAMIWSPRDADDHQDEVRDPGVTDAPAWVAAWSVPFVATRTHGRRYAVDDHGNTFLGNGIPWLDALPAPDPAPRPEV